MGKPQILPKQLLSNLTLFFKVTQKQIAPEGRETLFTESLPQRDGGIAYFRSIFR